MIKHVLLDAGHGGIINGEYQTDGKRSPIWSDGSQYFEGHGNRLIRDELSELLRVAKIPHSYVNHGADDMPLGERVRIANELARKYGKNETLYISIHSDAFSNSSAHGWSCYTSKGNTMADQYANALYKEIEKQFPTERLRKDFTDGDEDKEASFYVLKNTICPAILSENFFMTNERECKEILMTECGRKKIANAHFQMIKKYFK